MPRWLIATLLTVSALVPLCACAWWIIWPRRTAEHFISLVREARFDEANQMLSNTGASPRLMGHWMAETFQSDPEFRPRSLTDLILGRLPFERETYQRDRFIAERGGIIYVTEE
jgi:hypothetical protein